jgi:ABC-type cobalamin/Fe3+-siderophores transport system ATPase subunit
MNLEVKCGESMVVIGGSGTGKSVLIKCIIGLLRHDRGEIYVDGTEINEPLVSRGFAWASRRSLGKLADDPRFCLAERDARRGQAGLWRLPTKERRAPWEHRDAQGGRAVRFTDFDGETAEACLAAFGKR